MTKRGNKTLDTVIVTNGRYRYLYDSSTILLKYGSAPWAPGLLTVSTFEGTPEPHMGAAESTGESRVARNERPD